MKEKVKLKGFKWAIEIVDKNGNVKDRESKFNIVPDAGLEHLLRSPFGDAAAIENFYLGLYLASYNPTNTTKAADIPVSLSEFVDYEEELRPEWVKSFTPPANYSNEQSKAVFTVTKDKKIQGCFLVSNGIKNDGAGLMISCVRFTSPKDVVAGDKVRLVGGISFTSDN